MADSTEDTGESIKKKIYGLKSLHPTFFSLHTRYVKSSNENIHMFTKYMTRCCNNELFVLMIVSRLGL